MSRGIYHAPWEKAFDRLMTPLEEFIHRQTTSGILLMACAVIALVIANSPWHDVYEDFLQTAITLGIGEHSFSFTVHHWINELLMTFFFLVMGLELKRELLVGELSSPRQAFLPIAAALGGMLIPALGYWVFNTSGPGVDGWGIPMATDIAFAIGALSLLGSRIPKALVTFLIALAIVDDLGAVAVIALFYTDSLNINALLYTLACSGLMVFLNIAGIRASLPYAIVGSLLWVAMLACGIHATIAGVIIAFSIPIRPKFEADTFIDRVEVASRNMRRVVREQPDIIHNEPFRAKVTALGKGVKLVQAPAQRAERALHLPVAYLVIPIFALANAGIPVDFANFSDYLGNSITLGVLCGLVLGKPLGIAGFSWLAVKLGWADLPKGINFSHIIGVGLLSGIGFTMSIFIADLGFAGQAHDLLMAKTGILLASLVAGLSGFFLLRYLSR
ncbi:Na+/H+ antiporter NhaA [Parahaliea sp. F7430]|uniref:Na(+)/H(+) antiporter NhaA n=1 Tax=Sediminihaliea albiluteola TaxID=2758564 RepID=A0A7W2TWV2_9GAMM|nr:Na+/H+ antiporter NhaA [Sediminihaliea albiluteola]MBA6413427.1 Na+/H+ antiporter NhaA [Sediminihaliea albiluteola]